MKPPRIETGLSPTDSTVVLITPYGFVGHHHQAASVMHAALYSTLVQREVEHGTVIRLGGVLSRVEVKCLTEHEARVLVRAIDAMPKLAHRIEVALMVLGAS